MRPDYEKTYQSPDGGNHTLSFYHDPHETNHVVKYEHDGVGTPWSASKVAAEVKKEAGVEPKNTKLYEQTQSGQTSRYDFKQGHVSSVNPDGTPTKGPEKLRSSTVEFEADVTRIEDSRLDQTRGPRIDRANEMKR